MSQLNLSCYSLFFTNLEKGNNEISVDAIIRSVYLVRLHAIQCDYIPFSVITYQKV